MKYIFIALCLFIGACGKQMESPSTKVTMLMHMPMMEHTLQETSNPDLDFLVNMIPHHLGAVSSAEEYLKTGIDEMTRVLASNIILAQNLEIAEFERLVMDLSQEVSYNQEEVKQIAMESKKNMDDMMQSMSSIKLIGNVDKDFLMGMFPHHQGAIDASRTILKISTNEVIKEIANRIITEQEREIKEIEIILSNLS
ncbi:MAG: DUF305 domain-containing protein [Brevinema sp.]